MNVLVTSTKAEVLLSYIAANIQHNESQSSVADHLKAFNLSNNYAEKLPDSRYLLDKIFNSEIMLTYHAYCPRCELYIKTFDRKDKFIFCNICEENVALNNFENFFITVNIGQQVKQLLELNREYYNYVVNERQHNPNEIKDISDGKKYRNFIHSLPPEKRNSYASLMLNSDGSPVYKSSKATLWPVQMMVNEIPFKERASNTVVAGIWFGKEKPNMNIFLKPIVNEIQRLSVTGISCIIRGRMKEIFIYCICCCVDSPARCSIQYLIQYNGHYGCSWCLHPGIPVMHKVKEVIKYPLLDYVPALRRERDSLNHIRERSHGFQRPSVLLNLEYFEIIDGFFPDSMHAIDMGIVKKFTTKWFTEKTKPWSIPPRFIRVIEKKNGFY